MARVRIQVKGLARAQARVRKLPGQIQRGANAAVEQTAQQVMNTARRFAPVDTGALRASLLVDAAGDVEGAARRVITDVEYAIYQEFGTYKMAPTPFMTPAAEEGRRLLVENARRHIGRAVRGSAGGGVAGGGGDGA